MLSPDLAKLAGDIAARHAKIGTLVEDQGSALMKLWEQVSGMPPPSLEPPGELGSTVLLDLLNLGRDLGIGCQLRTLSPWTWAPTKSGGAPAGVGIMGPGADMRGFHFRPSQEGGKVESGTGIFPGVKGTYRARVRDAVIDGFRPWGGNLKGAAELTLENLTVFGDLAALAPGQHAEHGLYVGRQGWSAKVRALMEGAPGVVAPEVPAELVKLVHPLELKDPEWWNPSLVLWNPSLVLRRSLLAELAGSALQVTQRDRNSYGEVECPLDPLDFDADTGPTLIDQVHALECSQRHPSAVVSLFQPEHLASGRKMRRASAGAYVRDLVVENLRAKPVATQLFAAGQRFLVVQGGAFRRGDMGSTHRPLWALGNRYSPGMVGADGPIPAVVGGGPTIVEGVRFWSDQPTHVDVILEDGAPFVWRGCTLEDGSQPVSLRVNDAELGSVTQDVSS